MPRPARSPESPTVPVNVTMTEDEREAFRRHAAECKDGSLSEMLRRLAREDIERAGRNRKRKAE